jgi:hypothetical protein
MGRSLVCYSIIHGEKIALPFLGSSTSAMIEKMQTSPRHVVMAHNATRRWTHGPFLDTPGGT